LDSQGIDRVELAYAWHFLKHWPGDCFVINPTMWGVRYFDRRVRYEGFWRSKKSGVKKYRPGTTCHMVELSLSFCQMESHPVRMSLREQAGLAAGRRFCGGCLRATGFAPAIPCGFAAVRDLPQRRPIAVFFDHQCLGLGGRQTFCASDDPRSTPARVSEHHVPLGIRLHRRIVRNAAEFSGALIVPVKLFERRCSMRHYRLVLAEVPTHVENLPVSPAFLQPAEKDPELSRADYFIAVAAIDAHQESYSSSRGLEKVDCLPRRPSTELVIAGFRSVTSKPILDFVARNPRDPSKGHLRIGIVEPRRCGA